MNILHCADLHLGATTHGHLEANGLDSRLNDTLAALDFMVDYAIENGVDLFLVCGDIYHSRNPSPTVQNLFAKRIMRLTDAGITVFLLVGNHDRPNAQGRATSLDIFSALEVPHVYVGSQLQTYTIPTAAGPLQILAVPWPKRAPTRGMSIVEARQEVERLMSEAIAREVKQLDPSIPAIIAGHLTVQGATVGSERSMMMMGQDHVLPTSALAWPGIEYVALGHVHKHQEVGAPPCGVVYAGSIERVDFGEEGDVKGFTVVEWLQHGMVQQEFHSLPARRFVTVDSEVDAGDSTSITGQVILDISNYDIEGAIVRVRVKMPVEAVPLFDESKVRKALTDAGTHHIAYIKVEITGRTRTTRLDTQQVDGLQPIGALRAWMSSLGKDKEHQDRLVEVAEKLMMEVAE